MNRKEINLFNMSRATEQFIVNNYEVLKAYQPVIDSYNRLKAGNVVLDELHKTQSVDTKVKSGLKSKEKEELDVLTFKVTDAMTAYAVSNKDAELRMLAYTDKSTLKRLREVDYYVKIQAIYKAALPIADKLALWGVIPADVELLNTTSVSRMNRTPDIRNLKVITKQASTDIHHKILEVRDEIQNTLDALMKPLSTLQPTLYGQYMNARTIVETSASQTKKTEDTTVVLK